MTVTRQQVRNRRDYPLPPLRRPHQRSMWRAAVLSVILLLGLIHRLQIETHPLQTVHADPRPEPEG